MKSRILIILYVFLFFNPACGINYFISPCVVIKDVLVYGLDKLADYLIEIAHDVDKCESYKGRDLLNLVCNEKSLFASGVLSLLSMQGAFVAGAHGKIILNKDGDSLCVFNKNIVQLTVEERLPLTIALESLIKVKDKDFGIKYGGIFRTNFGELLCVKESMFSELVLSFLMSRLAHKVCPGQVATVVPIIRADSPYPWIGSLFKKDFNHSDEHTKKHKEMLLHFCLDLLDIGDRNTGNLGYLKDHTAFMVDLDCRDIDSRSRIKWLDKLSRYKFTNYNYELHNYLHHSIQDQEGYDALKVIANISDEEIISTLKNSYYELKKSLSINNNKLFSEKYINSMIEDVLDVKSQMKWCFENYSAVMAMLNISQKDKKLLKKTLLEKKIDDSIYDYFLKEARKKKDGECVQFL